MNRFPPRSLNEIDCAPARLVGQPNDRRVGYVPGVFDMLHIGHLNILKQARMHCDHLIVGVVTDEHAVAVKGRPPVIPQVERLELLRYCRLVDQVELEDTSKPEMWHRLRFDCLFKGDDWRGTPKGAELERNFAPLGVEIIYFPYTTHTSSTILRSHLEREVAV